MKHSFSAKYKNVLLRDVQKTDLEILRTYRNDRDSTKFLSKLPHITMEMQLAWYNKDLSDITCCTFAIEETDRLNKIIGSLALYNISDNTAEFGRALIGDADARGKGMGFLATTLCLYLGFTKLGLETITANVHEENMPAIHAYEKSGFIIIGKQLYEHGGNEYKIVVKKVDFFNAHDFISDIQTF